MSNSGFMRYQRRSAMHAVPYLILGCTLSMLGWLGQQIRDYTSIINSLCHFAISSWGLLWFLIITKPAKALIIIVIVGCKARNDHDQMRKNSKLRQLQRVYQLTICCCRVMQIVYTINWVICTYSTTRPGWSRASVCSVPYLAYGNLSWLCLPAALRKRYPTN